MDKEKKMDILIVEDDKLTLNLLQFCIQNLGHNAHLAIDAAEAIETLNGRKFDLIITDIMMPGVSGLSFVTTLRTIQSDTTPIIMMSALNNDSLFDKAFEAGANDFIAKPFSMEDFAEKLKKFTGAKIS